MTRAHFDRLCRRHTLRSLLGGLVAALFVALLVSLGMDQGDPARRARSLEAITREVGRMSRLAGDLLVLSSASGEREISRSPVAVADLLEEAAEYAAVRGTHHRVEVAREAGEAVLEADGDQVLRVLTNLLDNAFKYTPPGGRVSLRASVEPEVQASRSRCVILEVSDDGPGIPPEEVAHVFQRFYRTDASRSRDTGGTGLGLAIVKAMVDRHGGRVDLRIAPGRGTTIRVFLPLRGPTRTPA